MGIMDVAEVEESLFAASDAKLHRGMCKILSAIVCKLMAIFPALEAARPRCKSGIQALCSLHVALDKAKSLLQHCSDCSKLYLAITGDSVMLKFEKARCALLESLRRVEDVVPQAIGSQVLEIVTELEGTVFSLDPLEKQVGEEVIALLQQERNCSSNSNDAAELETFHQAASRLGITSSRAALAERRALKRLLERARCEDDKRKESIVAYLLHLIRKYSKLFRSECSDDGDSQGSTPCSPTVQCSVEEGGGPSRDGQVFGQQLSKLSSFNLKNGRLGNTAILPEEFRCPISLQLMYDPVIISSGQTYERVCIEKWFDDGHVTCPKTQQQLTHLCLTPNYCVKGLIASWCEQNGIRVPDGPPASLDLNYWRWVLSGADAENSRSVESIDLCRLKGVKVVPLEESGGISKPEENEICGEDDSCEDREAHEITRYEKLQAVLSGGDFGRQWKAVEEIRFLLKDDEEARVFMGGNGFVEALVRFLRLAVDEGDEKAQETGAMALFNLAVNNNRNKALMLSAGVIPLLEQILRSKAYEAAAALYLNLSCLDQAKLVIGSSEALPFLVLLLRSSKTQCKLDAMHALYNLSTLPANLPRLLSAGIVANLRSLLCSPDRAWTEKSISVLANVALNASGKKEIISVPGLMSSLAGILDSGEPIEQEQAVSCLLALCAGDEKCSHLVLREGVIPALVSLSINGTARAKDKAQRLLQNFREQRQRDSSPVRQPQGESGGGSEGTNGVGNVSVSQASKPLCKSTSRRLGRTLSSLWKTKSFSIYQC